MSCNYADGLSPYDNKGKLGLKEEFDTEEEVDKKIDILAEWVCNSNHVVVHTGAGISTSAGIPDFRGPNGVWTLEAKGLKPSINISFNDAVPTKTHMALKKMIDAGKVHFIVSQNIDGLHLKSGVARKHLAELHGNMFVEQCNHCQRQFVRKTATTSVGQKSLQTKCPGLRLNGRPCRGDLHDVILDWEHNLPERDLGLSDFHSCCADLSICLGTTLQITPSGTLPLNTKKYNDGRLVICNLQPTKYDKKADLVIHTYVDDIMVKLMKKFELPIPNYNPEQDPTKRPEQVEWTIPEKEVKTMRKRYEEQCCKNRRKKIKLEKPKKEDNLNETTEPKGELNERNTQNNYKLDNKLYDEKRGLIENCNHSFETKPECKIKLEPKEKEINGSMSVKGSCNQISLDEKVVADFKQEVNEKEDVSDSNEIDGGTKFRNSHEQNMVEKSIEESGILEEPKKNGDESLKQDENNVKVKSEGDYD